MGSRSGRVGCTLGPPDIAEPGEPHGAVHERALPPCVRDALETARRSRPGTDVTCLAFRTRQDGRDTARMGPDAALIAPHRPGSGAPALRARDLLVLSVTVSETTVETVQTVTHVLVTRMRPRPGATPGTSNA